jgi:DNA-binding NarL/FixJ family response regulator
VRLLLIDDHPLFRQGFSAMLAEARPDWVVVSASCAAEGEAAARDPELDLILVDLALPDADGFDTIERIGAIAPSTPRVVISARTDEGAQRLAIKAGASGFISKGDDSRAVLSCLERVVDGASGFEDGVVAEGLILSPRQIEVLALVAEGCPNKEIRHRLGIAERTVRFHLTDVFATLGVQSRVQAVLRAQALGLLR